MMDTKVKGILPKIANCFEGSLGFALESSVEVIAATLMF